MTFEQWGAAAFGLVIGWFTYLVVRHRTTEYKLADIGTLIGIIGGAAVLKLFPEPGGLFAAYAIGLAVGFFLYFLMLVMFVLVSKRFTVEWFLDGRKPVTQPGESSSGDRPMGEV
jgi:hypothetical protein